MLAKHIFFRVVILQFNIRPFRSIRRHSNHLALFCILIAPALFCFCCFTHLHSLVMPVLSAKLFFPDSGMQPDADIFWLVLLQAICTRVIRQHQSEAAINPSKIIEWENHHKESMEDSQEELATLLAHNCAESRCCASDLHQWPTRIPKSSAVSATVLVW